MIDIQKVDLAALAKGDPSKLRAVGMLLRRLKHEDVARLLKGVQLDGDLAADDIWRAVCDVRAVRPFGDPEPGDGREQLVFGFFDPPPAEIHDVPVLGLSEPLPGVFEPEAPAKLGPRVIKAHIVRDLWALRVELHRQAAQIDFQNEPEGRGWIGGVFVHPEGRRFAVISLDVQASDRGRRDIELVTWGRRDDLALGRPDVIRDIDRAAWAKTRPGAVKAAEILEGAK